MRSGPGGVRASRGHLAEFAATVAGLLALADWLKAFAVTHVAMGATGVYWRPVVRHEALFDRVG